MVLARNGGPNSKTNSKQSQYFTQQTMPVQILENMDISAIYYIYNITYHTITTYNMTLCIEYFITLNTQHVITFHYITLQIS